MKRGKKDQTSSFSPEQKIRESWGQYSSFSQGKEKLVELGSGGCFHRSRKFRGDRENQREQDWEKIE